MKYQRIWQLSFASLGIALSMGCAHSHTRGTVVLSDAGKEAHVCIGEKEVKPGDILNVYESVCKRVPSSSPRGPQYKTACQRVSRGHAEVESSDEHYSRVKALRNLNLKEGQIVEKAEN